MNCAPHQSPSSVVGSIASSGEEGRRGCTVSLATALGEATVVSEAPHYTPRPEKVEERVKEVVSVKEESTVVDSVPHIGNVDHDLSESIDRQEIPEDLSEKQLPKAPKRSVPGEGQGIQGETKSQTKVEAKVCGIASENEIEDAFLPSLRSYDSKEEMSAAEMFSYYDWVTDKQEGTERGSPLDGAVRTSCTAFTVCKERKEVIICCVGAPLTNVALVEDLLEHLNTVDKIFFSSSEKDSTDCKPPSSSPMGAGPVKIQFTHLKAVPFFSSKELPSELLPNSTERGVFEWRKHQFFERLHEGRKSGCLLLKAVIHPDSIFVQQGLYDFSLELALATGDVQKFSPSLPLMSMRSDALPLHKLIFSCSSSSAERMDSIPLGFPSLAWGIFPSPSTVYHLLQFFSVEDCLFLTPELHLSCGAVGLCEERESSVSTSGESSVSKRLKKTFYRFLLRFLPPVLPPPYSLFQNSFLTPLFSIFRELNIREQTENSPWRSLWYRYVLRLLQLAKFSVCESDLQGGLVKTLWNDRSLSMLGGGESVIREARKLHQQQLSVIRQWGGVSSSSLRLFDDGSDWKDQLRSLLTEKPGESVCHPVSEEDIHSSEKPPTVAVLNCQGVQDEWRSSSPPQAVLFSQELESISPDEDAPSKTPGPLGVLIGNAYQTHFVERGFAAAAFLCPCTHFSLGGCITVFQLRLQSTPSKISAAKETIDFTNKIDPSMHHNLGDEVPSLKFLFHAALSYVYRGELGNPLSEEENSLSSGFLARVPRSASVIIPVRTCVVERLLSALWCKSFQLISFHAPLCSPADIEKAAVRLLGLRIGPLALLDLYGIDVVTHFLSATHAATHRDASERGFECGTFSTSTGEDRSSPRSLANALQKMREELGPQRFYAKRNSSSTLENPTLREDLVRLYLQKPMGEQEIADALLTALASAAVEIIAGGDVPSANAFNLLSIASLGLRENTGGLLGLISSRLQKGGGFLCGEPSNPMLQQWSQLGEGESLETWISEYLASLRPAV